MLRKTRSKAVTLGWALGLGAVLAFAIIYSLLAAIGPSHMGDDISYAFSAHYAAAGTFKETATDILTIRVLQIVPIAIFYKAFGVGIYSSAGWDIMAFVLTVLLTYLIGKELYDKRVGLLSALLLAVFPMVAIYSTTMNDNIPLMFFAALAVFAFIRGWKGKSRLWFIISGVATASAPSITPEGFIVWIIIALLFLYGLFKMGFRLKSPLWFMAVGFIIGMALLLLFNYVNCGNPLINIAANATYYSQIYRPDITPQPVIAALMFYPDIMFPYGPPTSKGLLQLVDSYKNNWNKVGFFLYAFLIAGVYLVAERDRRIALPMAWFMVGILFLEFGPQSFSLHPLSYVLSHRLDRYITLVAPPLAIVIGAAVFKFIDESRRRWRLLKAAVLFVLLAFLIVTAMQINIFWHSIAAGSQYDQLQIAGYLNALPNTIRVYYDPGYGDLAVYMKFDNSSRLYTDYDGIQDCHNFTSGSYVVVPRYENDGFAFAPDPLGQCAYWQLVLSPQFPGINANITAPVMPFESDLYYVPSH